MKKDTHPEYHTKAKVRCACGKSYTIGSTVKEIAVELCSGCHPFYTGKQKLVDSARRVEKFKERAGKKEAVSAVRGGKKNRVAKRVARKAAATKATKTTKAKKGK